MTPEAERQIEEMAQAARVADATAGRAHPVHRKAAGFSYVYLSDERHAADRTILDGLRRQGYTVWQEAPWGLWVARRRKGEEETHGEGNRGVGTAGYGA